MTLTRLFVLCALVALFVLPVSPAFARDASTPVAPAADPIAAPPQPLAGQATWAENCAPCHGATGQGDGPNAAGLGVQPAALGRYDMIAGRSLQDLFDVTKNGRMQQMMPPWKNQLSDQQIWDVVAYAWSLHTGRDEAAQGQTVYEANCASCHGVDGVGKDGAPDLSDFAATSQVSQAQWAEAVAKGKGAMPAFAGKLSDTDQRAALTYARTLSLAGPLFREALAKGTGVISGTVINKTTGKPLVDATVLLGIFDQTSQLEQRTAKTDAAGFYKFDQLPTDSTLQYAVRADYLNVPYSSEFVSLGQAGDAADLPISVYETTDDASGIRADQVHYIMEFDGGRVLVAELIVLSLDGDRTYVGDGNHVLQFPLPEGVQDLSFNDGQLGDRYLQGNSGFVDRLPLPPGQASRQILFRYALPYSGSSIDLVRSLPYPAAAVNALIADVGQKVASQDLVDGGRRETQNGAYLMFSAANVPANKPVRLSMTGLPGASGSGVAMAGSAGMAAGGLNRWVVVGLIALAAAAAAFLVALPIFRSRSGAVAGAGGGALSREQLVDMLAGLDLAYEAGQIGESVYRDERMRLKAQLRDVMRRDQG